MKLQYLRSSRDMEGNSALHYATQMWSQTTVRKLLEKGANIGLKNNWDETPISKINPDTMEDFLDEYCLTSKNDIHQEDFELNMKYAFIAPPVDNPHFDETDPEGQEYIEKQAYPETETLWYMAQSKPHRHLLKHPVITSFLWMKWQRIRKQFNRNLRLYLLFVMTLTWYIFERFGGVSFRKDDPGGTENKEESFCSVKRLGTDMSIGFWYTAFLIQSICQFLLILRHWRRDLKESNWKVALQVFFTSWLEYMIITITIILLIFQAKAMFIVLTILLALVSFREGLQMMVSLKKYVFGAENWLEIATIVLVGVILYVPDSRFEDACETKRHLAAIAIVLSWATLITLVGRHPKLSRYNIYVTMFYKILETFVTFLLWYSFFLIAFSLGFYIMLHQDLPNRPPPSDYLSLPKGLDEIKLSSNLETGIDENNFYLKKDGDLTVQNLNKKKPKSDDYSGAALAVIKPHIGKKKMKKLKKAEREKTKGSEWNNMPALEMTEERQRDLELLQMRGVLDPKRFYKKNASDTLPKYYQIGTIVDSAADFYTDRVPQKDRKQTMVDELLADAEFKKFQKRKYVEIIEDKSRKQGKKFFKKKKRAW